MIHRPSKDHGNADALSCLMYTWNRGSTQKDEIVAFAIENEALVTGMEDSPPSIQNHLTEAPATSMEDPPPSTQSHLMIKTITDTAAIVQDIDQVKETKEKESTSTPEPPITDNNNNELQAPTTSSPSKTN